MVDDEDEPGQPDVTGRREVVINIFKWIAKDRIPRRVAAETLKSGFQPIRKNSTRPINVERVEQIGELAKALGFKSHNGLYPAADKGKPTDEVERDLRHLYRIDQSDGSWQAYCSWDFEQFVKCYIEEHKDGAACRNTEPTARLHDPTVKLVAVRPPLATPDDGRPNLASLSLFLQQAGPGQSIPVSIELICEPEPIGNFVVAVYRGRLEIVPGVAAIDQASDAALTLPLSDRTLTLNRHQVRRTDGRIAWTVASDKGPIGILRLKDDQPLCSIADPAEGEKVIAEFQAYFKDLDLADPDPDDDADDRKVSHSFLRPDGKLLSPNKRQLIKRLVLREEMGPAPNGWHTLAADCKKFFRDGHGQ